MKKFFSLCLLLSLFLSQSISGFAADFDQYLQEWKKVDPQAYAAHQKEINELQKRADKKARDKLTEIADKEFQNHFGTNIKISDIYKGMGVVEATIAGDFDTAARTGGDLFITTFIPALGSYITVVRTVNTGIKSLIKMWTDDLYQTKAYSNLEELVRSKRYNSNQPYIPSYMIKADFSNPKNAFLKNLKKEMQGIEANMYQNWLSKDEDHVEAVRILSGHAWNSRFISVLKKMPSDKEIFNHYLYRITSADRSSYMETLLYHYLEPAARKEARRAAKKYSAAMNSTINQAAQALKNDFRKVSGVFFKMGHTNDNGTVKFKGNFGFTAEKNRQYNTALQVYVGRERKFSKEQKVTTGSDGRYTGSQVYPPFPGEEDTVFAFIVQDLDGKTYNASTRINRRSKEETAQNKLKNTSENEWSQLAGPHISRIIEKMTEVHTSRGQNFKNLQANNEYFIKANQAYERMQSARKEIEDSNREVIHDKSTLDKEAMYAKYGPESGFKERADRMENDYSQAESEMKRNAAEYDKFAADFVAKQTKLYNERKKLAETFNSPGGIKPAIEFALSSGWADRTGVAGILREILQKMKQAGK